MTINPALLELAQNKVWGDLTEKRADPGGMGMPTPGGGPPAGPAGAMPAAGGAPAGPPGMTPAPAPGMDPSMGGGMPQPGMAGPGGMPQPGMQQQPQQKIKPEQWMQMLDYRMYNLQQQLTAIMNALQVTVPAGALVMPPGTPAAPPAEAAMPGGSADPSAQQQGGGGGQSAIGQIDPIQGASPELAQGGAGGGAGGGVKTSSERFTESLLATPVERAASYVGEPYDPPSTQARAAAVAAMFRSKTRAAA